MSEIDDLAKEIATLQERMQGLINANRNQVLEEMRNNVRQYGFTAQELGLSGQQKKGVKAKKAVTYRDKETGSEWDGELNQKGRKPQWIKDRIADGSIEQFRV